MVGWLATLVVVVSYDTYALVTKRKPTMSVVFGRAPLVATVPLWAGLTIHLYMEHLRWLRQLGRTI